MVLPPLAEYAAVPSKIPGVGLPSSIISPWREMIRYLNPLGRSSQISPLSCSGVGSSGP